MQEFTLYGKPSSLYEYAKMMILKQAERAGVQLKIREISDTDAFINTGIMSIPAAKVDNEIIERGDRGINNFISEVNHKLLKQNNFGLMRKLIIPMDFSETSENALNYAHKLSKHTNSMLKLMHIYTPTDNALSTVSNKKELEAKLESYIERFKRPWIGVGYDSLMIDQEFKIGLVDQEIVAYADSQKSSWIVMGVKRNVQNTGCKFGGMANKIAKNAKAPVLIIPEKALFSPLMKIAYCVDDDFMDTNVIEELTAIATKFDAEIHLVRAHTKKDYDETILLNSWKAYYSKTKVFFHTVDGLDLIKSITNFADEEGVDMIVMSRANRGFFGELFHRSITKGLVLTTEVPLLIFHK